MTIDDIIDQCDRLGLEVSIERYHEMAFAGDPWRVRLEGKTGDIEIRVTKHGLGLEDVLNEAWVDFDRTMGLSLRALQAPIEHQVPSLIDDEIPF